MELVHVGPMDRNRFNQIGNLSAAGSNLIARFEASVTNLMEDRSTVDEVAEVSWVPASSDEEDAIWPCHCAVFEFCASL